MYQTTGIIRTSKHEATETISNPKVEFSGKKTINENGMVIFG